MKLMLEVAKIHHYSSAVILLLSYVNKKNIFRVVNFILPV